ncbi:hypothetical protein SAMN06265365_1136 [Tistlia consotensis]|uniref:Mor transcription activator family protein n=1 Tax=Tistlia consotensis USBA 355 TaxID=560819 RepID=A0A1Y6CHR8_9PROT|nr:hypothetical protein [Tistlia consotensis]SMF42009.1 hypothetical protein SAMN05428998_114139 [Tistlia consotensis USBA 355]SMF66269.1 hypothetical protein SAMN05428998_12691 [Tistlia consotensis USBA 355]SNR73144.1 hypothetical protein SAMN06265365_1136 [Tistlia consotensis]
MEEKDEANRDVLVAPGITRGELLAFYLQQPNKLPMPMGETTSNIFSIVGYEGLFALIDAFGGSKIYVSRFNGYRKLIELVGEEKAAALYDHYHRDYIELPSYSSLVSIYRPEKFAELREDGVSTGEMARRYGLTERGVRYVLARTGGRKPTC